jgi:hypothetical protein
LLRMKSMVRNSIARRVVPNQRNFNFQIQNKQQTLNTDSNILVNGCNRFSCCSSLFQAYQQSPEPQIQPQLPNLNTDPRPWNPSSQT